MPRPALSSGYRPLFFMLLVTIGYVCIQEMVARLGTHTGKGLAALIQEQFFLRLSAFAVLAFAVANVGLVVTEFAGIGTALRALRGISATSRCRSPPSPSGCWSSVGSYSYAERVFLLLTLVFISYPIAMVLGHPDWGQVVSDTFIPHVIGSKAFLLVAVALADRRHPVHPALHGRGGGRPGRCGRGVPLGAGGRGQRGHRVEHRLGVHHHCHRRSHRRHRRTRLGRGGAKALEPLAGQLGRGFSSASGYSGRQPWLPRWCRCRASYAVAEAVGVERSVSRTFRQAPLFLGTVHRPAPDRGRSRPHSGQPLCPSS